MGSAIKYRVDLKKELSSCVKLVEGEIARYTGRGVDELYEPLRDLLSRGGKRIRPALCMASCKAVGGKQKDALKTAAAIEMIHNFTLIHDDIADRSELRRGEPCLHHRYGLGTAINSGDGLFSAAYEALGDAMAGMSEKTARDVFEALSSRVTRVCEGQALDISWVEKGRWDLNEKDYFSMIERKTGALMAASCMTGAMIGGGKRKQIEALGGFGMDIGVGFQIHDDVLNLRGDAAKYGKEIGGDINEGKRTLIVAHTLSVCLPAERERLIRILDKKRNSDEEIKEAISMLDKYGSIDRAADRAKEIIKRGKDGLGALPDSTAKETLLAIADYMVDREI